MTEEKKSKIQSLQKAIKAMTPAQLQTLADKFGIVTIDGHSLSLHNNALVILQNPKSTVVGGFKQWLKAGRAVKKGEHGSYILVPSQKDKDDSEAGIFFFTGTIFDISQTMEIETPGEAH